MANSPPTVTGGYNERMAEEKQHSRRAFLQGRAAAQTVAERLLDVAQQWADSATELIADRFPETPTIHVEATRRAMACEFAVRYHEVDRQLVGPILAAFDEIETVEDRLTIYRDESEVVEVNRQSAYAPCGVGEELYSLLQLSEKLYFETEGAFDITGTPLSRVWGFFKRAGRLPSEEEIAAARAAVGMPYVKLTASDHSVEFTHPGVEINFNAIGKGYALDRIAAMLDERGAHDYLWHGGRSSILARGRNHGDDRECWSIGLQDPIRPQTRLGEFHLRSCALGTSGGGTQFFECEGRRYSHILDPRTGWPAGGVYTATVISASAAEADALSTAAFVLGPEGTARLCRRRPDIGVVLVCPSSTEFGMTVFTGNLTAEVWTPQCDPQILAVL
jgi:thiamine biosynthesis lipoprotein